MLTSRSPGAEIQPLKVPKSLMNPGGWARELIRRTDPLDTKLPPEF